MPWAIIFIVAGIILLLNSGWFSGAALVGGILLGWGVFIFVIVAILFLLALSG